MSKTKQDRVDNIVRMTEIIQWAIKLADARLAIPEDMISINNEHIIEGEKWLEAIFLGDYEKLRKTWKLRTPEIWNNYDLYGGFDDHAEVKLLRTAKHLFRSSITSQKRPDLFKSTKVEQWKKQRERKQKSKKK